METCKNCGKELMSQEKQETLRGYGDYCDGVMTYDTDPFAVEINDDYTKYWSCEGGRYESAMDI